MGDEAKNNEEKADARGVLRELQNRWRGAQTLEYRSDAVMEHMGEFRVEVSIHARLRRPDKARLVFQGNRPEASRVRLIDGASIYDRGLRSRSFTKTRFRGNLVEEIMHPLDDAGWSLQQYFSDTPFLPPWTWGTPGAKLSIAAVRTDTVPKGPRPREKAYRLTIRRGADYYDTLWIDAIDFAPLRLVRYGSHGGTPQVLLEENFVHFHLGAPLPPSLFVWNDEDAAGKMR